MVMSEKAPAAVKETMSYCILKFSEQRYDKTYNKYLMTGETAGKSEASAPVDTKTFIVLAIVALITPLASVAVTVHIRKKGSEKDFMAEAKDQRDQAPL